MGLIPGAMEALTRDVARRIEAGVAEGARITKKNLDQPGSGVHYPWLPNRSSAPDEFPARQFDDLYNSIGYEQTGTTTFEVGSIHDPPEHAHILEYNPATKKGGGVRPWLSRTFEDRETRDKMLRASLMGGGG